MQYQQCVRLDLQFHINWRRALNPWWKKNIVHHLPHHTSQCITHLTSRYIVHLSNILINHGFITRVKRKKIIQQGNKLPIPAVFTVWIRTHPGVQELAIDIHHLVVSAWPKGGELENNIHYMRMHNIQHVNYTQPNIRSWKHVFKYNLIIYHI